MSFFIYTSKGVINRDHVVSVVFHSNGVEFRLSNQDMIYLAAEEGFLALHALLPNFTIATHGKQESFIAKYAKRLEDAGSKISSSVASKSKGEWQQ